MLIRLIFVWTCLLGSLALAQPAEVSRVLRTFDFEERRLGNAEELPMHWVKLEGAGLPHYVNGTLTRDRARSGKYSFRIDLDGGSAIFRYEAGQLRIRAGATYKVEAFVKTTALPHARAQVTAYYADQDGHPIPSSTRKSPPFAAGNEEEPWKQLRIELEPHPKAASVVIEIALLQPALYAPTTLGDRALYPQDIRGTAWFDDISVSQVPQVQLGTDRPGNIFTRDDRLSVKVTVNDHSLEDLSAQLTVHNALGKVVFQRSGALDFTAAEVLGPGQKRITLDLPETPPGWYEVTLQVQSQQQPLEEQTLNFIRLADNELRVRPDSRFGLVATDLPLDGWQELPEILPTLAAGRVKLAVWSKAEDIQSMDPAAFDALLERLGKLGIAPTACLVDLPPTITEKIGGTSWLQLLKAKPQDWQPQLAYMISRHGSHLDRWQLGSDGLQDFVTQPQMREVYQRVYQQFGQLIFNPDLAMPWPAWYEMGGELPATVALSVPSTVLPHQLPLYTQELRGKEGHNLSLSLELLDRARYGRETQICDLAERVIYALAAGETRIDLPLPFSVERRGGGVVKQPKELLIILRTLLSALSGATYQGRVPLEEGIEAFLFDRDGQGILALWDRAGTMESDQALRELTINLGPGPTRLDLWGNTSPLLRAPGDRLAGHVRLRVGRMPTFLMGIDGHMAQLRANVAFDRPLLESSFRPHTRHLKFVNTYTHPISGTLKLKPPTGWTINPPTFNFSLNPGETFDRELTIEFPYNSFAGAKTVSTEFRIQGIDPFNVPLTLKLGLSDVGMQTFALRDGDDVVVQQMITNYGDAPIDYDAFAVCPGQARQGRLVQNLGPGKTVMKRYRFTRVDSGAKRVRVGVKEIAGTRVLNDEIEIQ